MFPHLCVEEFIKHCVCSISLLVSFCLMAKHMIQDGKKITVLRCVGVGWNQFVTAHSVHSWRECGTTVADSD